MSDETMGTDVDAALEERAETVLVGAGLRAVRAVRGMSRAEVAEATGLAPETVRNCESGRAAMSSLFRVCRALDTDVAHAMLVGELALERRS